MRWLVAVRAAAMCTHHVYSRTHSRGACGRHNASLRDGARRDVRVRAAERLFLCARSSTSRQLREAGSTHGRRARSLVSHPSRRRSRGVTCSRLHRRSLFTQRAGSAGSAPHVRMDAGYGVASAAAGVARRSVASLGHVYAPCVPVHRFLLFYLALELYISHHR